MTIILIFQIGNVKGAEETVKTAKALDIRDESHIVQYTYSYYAGLRIRIRMDPH
jgi:hypothetical protein